MKETTTILKDKIENVRQVEIEKQLVLTGKYIPQKGHTLFEVNKVTGEVVKASFEDVKAVDYISKKGPFRQITTKKVIVRENCTYISALNIKNCFKKLGFVIKKNGNAKPQS